MNSQLTKEEKLSLLKLAKESVFANVQQQSLPSTESSFAKLNEPGAAFVTLHVDGKLRGCMGTFAWRSTHTEIVQQMALYASTRDPRFPSIDESDLSSMTVEISVLSSPIEVGGLDEIQIGRDGLIISHQNARGVLLPQVATDRDWDVKTFLEHTCLKAGLPTDAWKREDVQIQRFEAEVFSEEED